MTTIAEVKSRHALADVASRTGIPLPPGVTRSISVPCPVPAHGHPDHSPSLRLYLADDYYCCLGCGSKGDVVQWVRDTEQVSVTVAIAKLDAGGALANAWAGQTPVQPVPRHSGAVGEAPRLERTATGVVHSALEAA